MKVQRWVRPSFKYRTCHVHGLVGDGLHGAGGEGGEVGGEAHALQRTGGRGGVGGRWGELLALLGQAWKVPAGTR